ncbi:MAG: hypothetical protein QG588_80 [Candidatus Poribacteria bacterium]|nr:hypothetical protein [Candidatus Poribacteria bacterium]
MGVTKKKSNKSQIIVIVIIAVICIAFAIYAFTAGRSYFKAP